MPEHTRPAAMVAAENLLAGAVSRRHPMRARSLSASILILAALFLLAGCGGATRTPFTGATTKIDTDAINNGNKSLVMLRASTTWGSPAETQWRHVPTGELYKVSSQFNASTQEVAREYDMVTLPPGQYVLVYVMYSSGTGSAWPTSPFDINPTLSKVSPLGQVNLKETGDPVVTISSLRSTGAGKDGKTPLIASFNLLPGKAVYLGDMTVSFAIQGKKQLPGYYPAGTVSWSVKYDLEQARLQLGKEDTGLAAKLERGQITRGTLARGL